MYSKHKCRGHVKEEEHKERGLSPSQHTLTGHSAGSTWDPAHL